MAEWRVIDGYSRYMISKEGDVFSTISNIVMKKHIGGGYRKVTLQTDDRKKRPVQISVLLAKAFIQKETPDQNMVDHIDGDTLNDSLSNLRWVTNSQNQMNRGSRNGGVYRDRNRGGYQAFIQIDGKQSFLGRFKTFKEGKVVREAAAKIHYGKYKRK